MKKLNNVGECVYKAPKYLDHLFNSHCKKYYDKVFHEIEAIVDIRTFPVRIIIIEACQDKILKRQ